MEAPYRWLRAAVVRSITAPTQLQLAAVDWSGIATMSTTAAEEEAGGDDERPLAPQRGTAFTRPAAFIFGSMVEMVEPHGVCVWAKQE